MKKIFLFWLFCFSFNAFSGGWLWKQKTKPKPQKAVDQVCKNNNFCVFSNMPLFKQGAKGLWKTVAKLTGVTSIKKDMGYCAPTS